MMTLIVAVVMAVVVVVVDGELQRFEAPSKADGAVNVMVIGDWGRKGEYNQSLLARQVSLYSICLSLHTYYIYI